MTDEPDPPRKIYGFKSSEDFERANQKTGAPSDGPTDVQGMIASANADNLSNKANSPTNRPNEVHAMLQHNLQREQKAGLYNVSLKPDPRRVRRVRNFWIALILVDVPPGIILWKVGPGGILPMIFVIAGMAMFTSILVWRTWFLRTES